MNLILKASKVLVNEGPSEFIRKGSGVAMSFAGRSNALRQLRAEIEWRYKVRQLKSVSTDDYNNAWGVARKALYAKWGSLPCSRRDVRRLQSLHNKYKGERIFIIGAGPSINKTPLEKLEGEYTFGLNRVYLLFDRIRWRPTFYTTLDWRATPDVADEINALGGMTFFFPQRFRGLLRTGDDVYWYWQFYSHLGFLYDIANGVAPGGNVAQTAIQIAYHMGFELIYLVGMDTDYKILDTVKQSGPDEFGNGVRLYLESTEDDDPNHFDPRYLGMGRKWHNPNVPRMIEGYKVCKQAIEAKGRHIYNATIGGKLEVFERVDFNALF